MEPGSVTFDRAAWAALVPPSPPGQPLRADDELVDPDEVASVYLPLARYLELRRDALRQEVRSLDRFLAGDTRPSPFVVGIAGGVAAGKSTVARILQDVLSHGPGRPQVEVIGTDAFLLPNRVLDERGLMGRKGFPDTYDHAALLETLASIRAGAEAVAVPVYSHQAYDVLTDTHRTVLRPDMVIVEGLTVLQTGPVDGQSRLVSDFLDVALYIDSAEEDAEVWFTDRLLAMRTTESGGGSFLDWLSSLSEGEVRNLAARTWSEINLVNVRRHVAPTRSRADVVLVKDRSHRVRDVTVRRP